ncbi:riboflavin synthase domain-like protein [Clavulina sp. PMI_390]|nr:riboflavin synthase domain-like protein [Clavulina sp. PMI_390]
MADTFDGADRRLLVLYASETGTAEDVAFSITRHLRRWHWRPRTLSMAHFSLDDLLDEGIVITVCSTTGNGVEPQSMTTFWHSILRSNLPPDLLDHIDLASFSLGDSSYERFCWSGKKLHRRLVALGAHDIVERMDADEQHYLGIEGSLSPWIDALVSSLNDLYPTNLEPLPENTPPNPRIRLSSSSSPTASPRAYSSKSTEQATFNSFKRITRQDWYQDVRHIELDLGHDIGYEPGDIAVLYPSNQASEVESLVTQQGWASIADSVYDITSGDDSKFLPMHRHMLGLYGLTIVVTDPLPLGLPQSATLRNLLTHYLDIKAVPRRSFFEFCCRFASDDRECEKLQEFCTTQGQEELYDYVQRPRRTTLEVLSDFHSIRIPLDHLFDVFGVIRPRKFSIASYSAAHPRKIQLCVAMVRYKSLVLKAPRVGMCSGWLMNLPVGTSLRLSLGSSILGSSWRTISGISQQDVAPIICVGPGTGIAPLRAILEYRIKAGAHENLLFFGCRSKTADFHYREELEAMEASGHLKLRVAASRDQGEKLYVQDEILKCREIVYDYIFKKGGSLLISGSSGKMPTGVRRAVRSVLTELHPGWSEDDGEKYIMDMEASGRWAEETW